MAIRTPNDPNRQGAFFRRTLYLVALMGFMVLVLLARLSQLQFVQHSYYAGRAQANQMQPRKIAPRRGIIVDRNNEVIVSNRAGFRLMLVAEQVEDVPRTLSRLASQGFMKAERQGELLRTLRRAPGFEPVPIRTRLAADQVARFAVSRHQFAGVDIEGLLLREYPLGSAGAHALGYVAAVSAADRERLDPALYAGIPLIGRTGVEGSYEENLRGTAGGERLLTDAYGRQLARTSDLEPRPGADLQLALDRDCKLQPMPPWIRAAAQWWPWIPGMAAYWPWSAVRLSTPTTWCPAWTAPLLPTSTATRIFPCSIAPCAGSTRRGPRSSRCWRWWR